MQLSLLMYTVNTFVYSTELEMNNSVESSDIK